MTVTLRDATAAEVELLSHWDSQPHVIAASNTRAIRFYRRGFRDVGPRRFGQDDCLIMRIDRADWHAAR